MIPQEAARASEENQFLQPPLLTAGALCPLNDCGKGGHTENSLYMTLLCTSGRSKLWVKSKRLQDQSSRMKKFLIVKIQRSELGSV